MLTECHCALTEDITFTSGHPQCFVDESTSVPASPFPSSLPLEVAEQSAHQLPDAALVGWHHALQTHHQVAAVLGVEHHQLVFAGGHAHSRHLQRTEETVRRVHEVKVAKGKDHKA